MAPFSSKLLALALAAYLLVSVDAGRVMLDKRQQLGDLPPCVQKCLGAATTATTDCKASDLNCLCNEQSFVNDAGNCYVANCSPQDAQTGISFGQQTCNAIGVSVTFSASPSGASSASAAASSVVSAASSASASASASGTPKNSPASHVAPHDVTVTLLGLGLITLAAVTSF